LAGSLRGDEPEPAHREAYATEIRKHLPAARGPGRLEVLEAKKVHGAPPIPMRKLTREIARVRMLAHQAEEFGSPNLVFPIKGKNDELIVPSRLRGTPATGAVLGVELKKRIGPGDLYQAQAEWLLYGPQSMFPFMQVSIPASNGSVSYCHRPPLGLGGD
jgi:hypothetical protein